jgi:hypothetical protein
MPTPKPAPADGNPPENPTPAQQSPPQSVDYGSDDADATRNEDALPESLPSRSRS